MQIVHITNIGGKPHGIMDNNTALAMELIDGSPRVGCSIEQDGERWRVVGNNADDSCVNGVCPVR